MEAGSLCLVGSGKRPPNRMQFHGGFQRHSSLLVRDSPLLSCRKIGIVCLASDPAWNEISARPSPDEPGNAAAGCALSLLAALCFLFINTNRLLEKGAQLPLPFASGSCADSDMLLLTACQSIHRPVGRLIFRSEAKAAVFYEAIAKRSALAAAATVILALSAGTAAIVALLLART